MGYESKLDHLDHLDYQSSKLINPAKLCLLVSVSLHLLVLKFGLPSLNFRDNAGKREVSVIELNSEQQARLPNFSPQLNTPDVFNPNDLPPVDNGEPASPFAIPRSLIPGFGDPSSFPPLAIPPPPNFDLPALPPVTDIKLPPIGDLSNLPLPPEINPSDFKLDTPKVPTTDSTNKPGQPDQPRNNPPQAANSPQAPQTKTPDTAKPKPKPTPKQAAAEKIDNSQKRITNLSQSLTRNEEGTTDEDARENYIAWLTKVKEIEPDNIEVKGIYPRDACIRRLKGSSVFGVVINAKGEVVAQDLIKGAKYPLFNKQGAKDVAQLILENKTQKPKPYRVKVDYEYDSKICPSLTLPSIRRAEEKQKEQAPPEPAPKPQPEPTPPPEPNPEPKPESPPVTAPAPRPEPTPTPTPEPEPNPTPEPELAPKPQPEPTPPPEPNPEPSLRDRLRDIKLPDRKPDDLRKIPLPDRPSFKK